MSGLANKGDGKVVTHPDGSIQVGDIIHKPWPSLIVLPVRTRALHQEIIRADPGSPFFEIANRIPSYIRELVRALPSFQWSLLELAAANPKRGFRLLRDFPAVAVLIVRRYRPLTHGDRTAYLKARLAAPWQDLLCEFGLPPRPRNLRILGMLPREHCYTHVVDQLLTVLRKPAHPWIHVVPHLKWLTRDGVSLLGADPKYINPHLLRASVDSDFDTTAVFSTLMSVRHLLTELDRDEEWPYRGATFDLLKKAEGRLHDQVYVDYCLPFADPPIPGRPGVIEPIRDYGALIDEGLRQEHCVGTLVGEVVRQEFFAYQVLTPTRATLVLQRGGDTWQIHDLRGAKNVDVPAETQATVRGWMEAHTLKLKVESTQPDTNIS